MHRTRRFVAMALAGLMLSGCFGPFSLTRKLWRWNNTVSDNKWVREAIFLLCTYVPVYGVVGLGDALIFNSIEFWTGNNPITDTASTAGPRTKRVASGDVETVLTDTTGEHGRELIVEPFRKGQSLGAVRLYQQSGLTVASNNAGEILYRAQTLPDGSLLVTDVKGQKVAFYSSDQVERLVEASHR